MCKKKDFKSREKVENECLLFTMVFSNFLLCGRIVFLKCTKPCTPHQGGEGGGLLAGVRGFVDLTLKICSSYL